MHIMVSENTTEIVKSETPEQPRSPGILKSSDSGSTRDVHSLDLDSAFSSSLVSSAADSEEDYSSRENSDRSRSRRSKRHRVRFADTSKSDLEPTTTKDGFLFDADPFVAARRQCPRHILRSLDRMHKVSDAGVDEFGVVSKRALPEHYYANTGTLGLTPNRKNRRSNPEGRSWRDRGSSEDFSHPKCFANPKNNKKLQTIFETGYLDTELTASSSSTGRFDPFSKNLRETDDQRTLSPSDGSSKSAKSPDSGTSDGLYYGKRRPGIKIHSCYKDGNWS